MKLRALVIDKKFIPEFNGNKEQPAGEKIVIHFSRIPGTSEKANYKGFKFDAKAGVELIYNDNLLVQTFIKKIENLQINDQEVSDGKTLAGVNCPALESLFTEIRDYLFPSDETISQGEPQP